MKLALIIVLSLSLLAIGLFYFTVDHTPETSVAMPWHVTVHDDQHSEVFEIKLNETNLEQARVRFGQLEGISLYQDKAGIFSLEAYFGNVSIGLFSARIIANLQASQAELSAMTVNAYNRVITEQGSQKWTLKDEVKRQQSLRKVKSLTYIPGYSGMDASFIAQRFGEPESREKVDETTELWLYPKLGVRVLLDSDGKEVFEYMVLADFNQKTGVN